MTTNESNQTRQRIFNAAQSIISRKGFSAVGLNEVLNAAGVPKGSFYHYFASKDAFGTALLEHYFETYFADMDRIFQNPATSAHDALMRYWQLWISNQTSQVECGKCLAVKLGAEVADLSESMRLALQRGTAQIVERLEAAISKGVEDGTVTIVTTPAQLALRLYAMWLGASVMTKIARTHHTFEEVLLQTRSLLDNQ
ncbi:TetR/AcrR family transcriptional regulator [Pseudomonas sp. EA_35y_Pfl2_R111]|uniref:TetR/AcrR family transcriptional regulator n=1 Tax=Pseudomonas sp. EA_35y_Pfl2_R111 TaxID=3088689 RepID=UPI0030DC6F6D